MTMLGDLARIATAIITLGLISTLIVNASGTAAVIKAATGGLGTDLSAAERG